MNSREIDAGTPYVRSAVRASTQRKPAREEVEGSKVSVSVSKRLQRGARAAEGMIEQENKDANVLTTPAPVGSRRRATAVSTRRKKEVEMVEEDADKNAIQEKPSAVANTPVAAPVSRRRATGRSVFAKIETVGGTSVQRAYSTRRSVRLLGKDLSKMSLMDTEDNELVKIHDDVSHDLSIMSEQVEDLSDTEKGTLDLTFMNFFVLFLSDVCFESAKLDVCIMQGLVYTQHQLWFRRIPWGWNINHMIQVQM